MILIILNIGIIEKAQRKTLHKTIHTHKKNNNLQQNKPVTIVMCYVS